MDMTAFQGMLPSGQSLLAPQQQPYPQASLLANPQATQPGITGIMGPYSQLAYQMAGSPKQGGAYASVAQPPGVPGSNGSSGSGVSALGGTALGILGALSKSPQLMNSLGSGAKSLVNSVFGNSGISNVGDYSGLTGGTPYLDAGKQTANLAAGDPSAWGSAAAPGSTADALSGYPIASSGGGILGNASPLLDQAGLGGAGLSSVGVGAAQTAADSSAAEAAQALGGAGSSSGGILGSGLSGTQALGAVAVPLSLLSEVKSWQSGATGTDALSGAETGAALGTAIMPGIGTAIGLVGGALAGGISSLFGNGKVDPENANFNQYTQAFNKAAPAQQQQVAAAVTNPYTALAGYFDLRPNQVGTTNTIYGSYGRLGEGKFTNDLISQVQKGQSSGITDSTQMWNQVISPWLTSKGNWSGGSTANSAAMTSLVQNMTGQIMAGTYKQNFKAVGGDSPFAKDGTWHA